MNSPVITADPSESIQEISQKMTDSKAGSVVITENDRPIGIVTDGDIVTKVVSKDSKPSSIKAVEVMSKPLYTIDSEKEIIEAARSMRKHEIKRLGVSYKNGLVGIISISDILAITPELFDIISEKAMIMTSQASKEPTSLAGYCDTCNQWSDRLMQFDGRFICGECTTGTSEEEFPDGLEGV
jgi:signal-transduction protein with cAMP-binding, CBS, and nucleotidyltransferase domain